VKKKSYSKTVVMIGAYIDAEIMMLGHQASDRERVLVAAVGEGREVSLVSHVPGMRATGKSQVAVKTIPSPTKNENRFPGDLAISRTFIKGPYCTPAPGNETSDVSRI